MRRRLLSSLLLAQLLLPVLAARAKAEDLDRVRNAFLARVNQSRQTMGLPPLRLSSLLSRFAQTRAEEIAARRGGAGAELDASEAEKAGYEPRLLTEFSIASEADVDTVFADAERQTSLPQAIGSRELRDLGVGMRRRDGLPVYVLLFGLSWEDFAAIKSQELSDLGLIRRLLLERVNRERTRRRLAPLREQPLLDEAAQHHAEDMLRRSYYGHESPEGTTALERSQVAGYAARFVAENIAQGQSSVEDVMDSWMNSQTHREHILSSLFLEMGSGVALGKNARGYQILWVQCFGRARPETSAAPRRRRPRG